MSRDGIICERKTSLYSVKNQLNINPKVITPEMLHCVTTSQNYKIKGPCLRTYISIATFRDGILISRDEMYIRKAFNKLHLEEL